MDIRIKPEQLTVYLMMAREYAKKCGVEQDMPKLESIIKELCRTIWDDNAELQIREP